MLLSPKTGPGAAKPRSSTQMAARSRCLCGPIPCSSRPTGRLGSSSCSPTSRTTRPRSPPVYAFRTTSFAPSGSFVQSMRDRRPRSAPDVVGCRERAVGCARDYGGHRDLRGAGMARSGRALGVSSRRGSRTDCESAARRASVGRRSVMTARSADRISTRPSVRNLLRTATAAAHERLHAHPGFSAAAAGMIGQDDYQRLLSRLLGFHRPFEGLTRAVADRGQVDLDLDARARSHALVLDLAFLGMDRNGIDRLPDWSPSLDLRNEDALLGALYVVEGSTLGGLQIARSLKARFGGQGSAGLNFFSVGESATASCGRNSSVVSKSFTKTTAAPTRSRPRWPRSRNTNAGWPDGRGRRPADRAQAAACCMKRCDASTAPSARRNRRRPRRSGAQVQGFRPPRFRQR